MVFTILVPLARIRFGPTCGHVAAADTSKPWGTGMVGDWPITWFRPRKMSMPANVTMNAGTIIRATQKPCHVPTRIADDMPTTIPRGQATPQSAMVLATTMPMNAATEPTDRSMWPAMMTMTIPMARIRM